MSIDEIVNFTYSRNKLLHKRLTKEIVKSFLEKHQDNIIEKRINGELIGVGFYWLISNKEELHIISATVKEGFNGLPIMLRALKDKVKETGVKYVSWFAPGRKFRRWKIKGRE